MSATAEVLLALGALGAYLGLGVWAPWKDSDHPFWWLILIGICGYAALSFVVPLAR